MRTVWGILIIALIGYAVWHFATSPVPARAEFTANAESLATPSAARAFSTPEPRPTATKDYVVTIAAADALRQKADANALQAAAVAHDAWSTAEAAHVAFVQITADAERRSMEVIQVTAASDALHGQQTLQANVDAMRRLDGTASAMPTVFPITQTAVQDAKTAVAIALYHDALTQQAPTQLVRLARAQASANTAQYLAWSLVGLILAAALLIFIGSLYLTIRVIRSLRPVAVRVAVAAVSKAAEPTITTPARVSADRWLIPCAPEELAALAQRLPLNAPDIDLDVAPAIRHFLQLNGFVLSAGLGCVKLSPDGRAFLEQYAHLGTVPTSYRFANLERPT